MTYSIFTSSANHDYCCWCQQQYNIWSTILLSLPNHSTCWLTQVLAAATITYPVSLWRMPRRKKIYNIITATERLAQKGWQSLYLWVCSLLNLLYMERFDSEWGSTTSNIRLLNCTIHGWKSAGWLQGGCYFHAQDLILVHNYWQHKLYYRKLNIMNK